MWIRLFIKISKRPQVDLPRVKAILDLHKVVLSSQASILMSFRCLFVTGIADDIFQF